MQAAIRLGLVALVIVAGIIGVRLAGGSPILVEDVRAVKNDLGTFSVTLSVRNSGEPDRLISVTSEYAEVTIVSSDGDALPIPAETKVSLTSEAAFIVIKDIRGGVDDGRLVPLLLVFERAGEITTKARLGKPMMMHGGMDHGSMDKDAMDKSDMAMMGTDYVVPDGETAPTLSISAAPREGGGYVVSLETKDFRFSKEAADGPHEAGVGHGHLYVGGVKLGRVYGTTVDVPPLPDGPQIVRVTLNTNDHRTYVVGDDVVTATVVVGEE